MTDKIEIGIADIAKFLYPLRNSSEDWRELVKRAEDKFSIDLDWELVTSDYDPAYFFLKSLIATEYIELDGENAKQSMWYGEGKSPYILTKKGKEKTQLNIEPTEIAKLLFPLKESVGETRGALVERVKSELNIDKQRAEWTIALMELDDYLVKDKVEGPWDSKMDIYSLTEKGEKTIQEYL